MEWQAKIHDLGYVKKKGEPPEKRGGFSHEYHICQLSLDLATCPGPISTMASALNCSARRLRLSVFTVPNASVATSWYAHCRSLSASVQRFDDEKPPRAVASDSSATSSSSQDGPKNDSSQGNSYTPPSSASSEWPFDSSASGASGTSFEDRGQASSSSSASTGSDTNPYKGLFDGSDPFPTIAVPRLSSNTSCSDSSPAESGKASWLSDQLDSLTISPRTSRTSNRPSLPSSADGRKKHSIPRSVLFADSENVRQSDDFRPRRSPEFTRKRFDRTPLTQQEANAFMSLLNQALAGTSSTTSTNTGFRTTSSDEQAQHTPFGSYTSLISSSKTQSGSRALLQAFAKRNRLKRFEEARAQRAKRFVREGLAAQIDPLQLEAGIDEAREQIAMCENLVELLEWTKKQVWGIASCHAPTRSENPADLARMISQTALANLSDSTDSTTASVPPKYGKDTPFYSSVLHLVFLAIRDRYRSPQVALSVARTTRSLGIESYVLGVTGSLYNEVLKTQWDWLGDLPGVVQTLRQARETGILSAPVKHSPTPNESAQDSQKSAYATSEDETIRETVDRIANDVRRYVLDQQLATDAQSKREYLYGENALDLLSAHGTSASEKKTPRIGTDWSQNWLLLNAEQATNLAGRPFRTMYKHRSRSEREQNDDHRPTRSHGAGERRSSPRFYNDAHRGPGERYPSTASRHLDQTSS